MCGRRDCLQLWCVSPQKAEPVGERRPRGRPRKWVRSAHQHFWIYDKRLSFLKRFCLLELLRFLQACFSLVNWTRCLSLHSLEKLPPKWLKSSRWGASVWTQHFHTDHNRSGGENRPKQSLGLRLASGVLMRRGKTTNLLFTLLQASCFRSKWVKCRSETWRVCKSATSASVGQKVSFCVTCFAFWL